MVAKHLGVAVGGAALLAAEHSQIVESISITNRLFPGLFVPAAHARVKATPITASSWRTCPNENDRKNVPSVDGAITR